MFDKIMDCFGNKAPFKSQRLSVEDMELLTHIMSEIDGEIKNLLTDDEKADYLQRAFKTFHLSKEGRFILRFMYGLAGFKTDPQIFKTERERGFEEGIRYVGAFFFKNYLDALDYVGQRNT